MARDRGGDALGGEMRIEITPGSMGPYPGGPPRPGDRAYGPVDRDALSFHPERLMDTEESDLADEPIDPQAWFVEAGDVFAQAFCVTLVKAVSVDEALARLKAKATGGSSVTFDDLVEDAYERQEEGRGWQLVGGCELDGWTLLLEPNGFVCSDPKRKRQLSKGTTAITYYLNFNGGSEFSLTTDGGQVSSFDMMFPAEREGDRPDELLQDMVAAGFSVDADEDEAADDDGVRWLVAGAALAERLTGIRLTVGLLAGLQYRTGLLKTG